MASVHVHKGPPCVCPAAPKPGDPDYEKVMAYSDRMKAGVVPPPRKDSPIAIAFAVCFCFAVAVFALWLWLSCNRAAHLPLFRGM